MRYLITLFILLILRWGAIAQTDSFIVDAVYRNYTVHLPNSYTTGTHYPLVLNLHGYTSNAFQQELYTGMDATADSNHFIVVYPNGIANYWNSFGVGANDVKFLRELIDTISAHYSVNSRRVYSCGMSNGGYMSYTLACALSTKIAAIASVAGVMSLNTHATCNPARKMPVMHIHGTTDPTVNYNTGAPNSVGVEQTLTYWRDTDQCSTVIDTTALPNTNTADSTTVQLIVNRHCAPQKEVRFYKIANGGHTWPNGVINIPNYGNTNRDFDASQEIWNFFNRFQLDSLGTTSVAVVAPENQLSIYPNPAENIVHINTERTLQWVAIKDLMGREVATYSATKTLDISNLQAGVYILQAMTEGGKTSSFRFVK